METKIFTTKRYDFTKQNETRKRNMFEKIDGKDVRGIRFFLTFNFSYNNTSKKKTNGSLKICKSNSYSFERCNLKKCTIEKNCSKLHIISKYI